MSGSILIPSGEDPTEDRHLGWWPILVVALVVGALALATRPAGTAVDDPLLDIPATAPTGDWIETPIDGTGTITAVADVGGQLVVVGAGRRIDDPPFAAVVDGSVDVSVGPWDEGDVITDLVRTPDGLIAVGHRLDPDVDLGSTTPAVWSSTDGRRWEEVSVTGLPDVGSVHAVVVTEGSLLAIGWSGPSQLEPLAPPAPGAEGRAWSSEDGVDWTEIPVGADVWFEDVTSDGSAALVTGRTGLTASAWSVVGGTWTAAPGPTSGTVATTGVVEDGTVLVIVRPLRDPEGIHTTWSVDGDGTWEEVAGSGSPDGAGWLASIGDGLLAGPAFSRSVYPTGPELRWTDDGTQWVGVEVTRGRSPWPPTQVTSAVGLADGSIVAAGSRGGRPALWIVTSPTN